MSTLPEKIVQIREKDCIGCAKCLDVCPTNAIVGAQKQQHTVIAPLCIGCGHCLPPCPTDCFEWITLEPLNATQRRQKAQSAKHQVQQRKAQQQKKAATLAEKSVSSQHISETLASILNQSMTDTSEAPK